MKYILNSRKIKKFILVPRQKVTFFFPSAKYNPIKTSAALWAILFPYITHKRKHKNNAEATHLRKRLLVLHNVNRRFVRTFYAYLCTNATVKHHFTLFQFRENTSSLTAETGSVFCFQRIWDITDIDIYAFLPFL